MQQDKTPLIFEVDDISRLGIEYLPPDDAEILWILFGKRPGEKLTPEDLKSKSIYE
jgi:hypothetical protein